MFSACQRLVDPAQMGTLFKVLCVAALGSGVPVAFEGAAATQRPAEPTTGRPLAAGKIAVGDAAPPSFKMPEF